MSISPPSDIVLDVARAADPARYSEAAARLTRTTPSTETFANFLSDTESAATERASTLPVASVALKKAPANSAAAFEGFEAMALATMIEASMPGDATAVFGSGTAGSVWKSMLAEQLGAQMAKAGGIGLAAQLARSAQAAIAGAGGQVDAGQQAKSLIMGTLERGFLQGQSSGEDSEPTSSIL